MQVRTLKPEIGAEVIASRADLLSGHNAPHLRALLEQRGVLVFPAIGFDEAELIAFTRSLGTFAPDREDESATAISIAPDGGTSADYTRGSFFWHFDGYMNPVPVLASLLLCEQPAPEGGDTAFANTYAAWEALDPAVKTRIEGLRVVHALAAAQRAVEPEPSHARFSEWLKVPSATLPLVWTHRSGRKSLVIGNSAAGVVGMDTLESLDLLVYLRDWATQERFCYRHTWAAGDLVVWDNTGTLHRAMPYDAASGRRMLRTKLAGEEPFA
jgi:alpha-ketoglutarate-dependent taurine dioxygenase